MTTQVKKAIVYVEWQDPNAEPKQIEVQYNPTEYSIDTQVTIGEVAIPGIEMPLQQFVRGNAEKLTLDLFFDTTEHGTGKGAVSVTTETDKIYQLIKIEPKRHAPPILTFVWSDSFPGSSVGGAPGAVAAGGGGRGRGQRRRVRARRRLGLARQSAPQRVPLRDGADQTEVHTVFSGRRAAARDTQRHAARVRDAGGPAQTAQSEFAGPHARPCRGTGRRARFDRQAILRPAERLARHRRPEFDLRPAPADAGQGPPDSPAGVGECDGRHDASKTGAGFRRILRPALRAARSRRGADRIRDPRRDRGDL